MEPLPLKPTPANIKAAERLMVEVNRLIELGGMNETEYRRLFPQTTRLGSDAPTKGTLFSNYADQWLATHRMEKSTREHYRPHLAYWKLQFHGKTLDAITAMDIRTAVAARAADVTGKTINNMLIPLRGVFETAHVDGLIASNPTATIRNHKHQAPPPDPFTKEEMHRILHRLFMGAESYYVWYRFAFATGLRPSEQMALRWSDVNLKARTVTVSKARVSGEEKGTKTHSIREVDLNDEAWLALVQAGHPGQCDLTKIHVFKAPHGGPWQEDDLQDRLNNQWYPVLDGLGIRRRRAYNTRHTYATINLMAGVNPAYIARQLGHVNTAMLFKVYAKWIDRADNGREAAKMNAAFGPALAPDFELPHIGAEVMASPRGFEPPHGDNEGNEEE